MLLDLAQYLDAAYPGHSDIQQKQIGGVGSHFRPIAPHIQKIQHVLAVLEMQEGITDTRTPQIFLDQGEVPAVVFGNQDDYILPYVCSLSVNILILYCSRLRFTVCTRVSKLKTPLARIYYPEGYVSLI